MAPAGCVSTPRLRPVVGAEAAHDLAAMFKALADPVRLRVLSAIAARAGGEACVCDVSDGLDVTQPTDTTG
ncbi:helix-turn-helix transcriptional regulator [Nocardia nova]|nr:helix-turn-helix transcriptional regulator [Nocardia nova]MDN2500773.1 helix-turn-helix transcriptional regulator [Nocardia nova]